MTSYLDQIGAYFTQYGVHPVLGGFLVGALVVGLLTRKKKDTGISFGVNVGASTRLQDRIGSTNHMTISTNHSSELLLTPSDSSMTINGQTVPLNPEQAEKLMRLVREGKMIEAIKEVRQLGSLDLKDAKDFVDHLSRGGLR